MDFFPALIPILLLLLGGWTVKMLMFDRPELSPRAGVLRAAIVTALGIALLLAVLARNEQYRGATELVWQSVEAAQVDSALVLGGDRELDGIAWPSRLWWPRLRAVPAGPDSTQFTFVGGRAFLIGPQGPANGVSLAFEQPRALGNYALQLERAHWYGGVRLAVHAPDGPRLFSIDLAPSKRSRCLSMSALVAPHLSELRAKGRGVLADSLERWALPIRLLVSDPRRTLAVGPADSAVVMAGNGSRWTLLWSGARQELEPGRTADGALLLTFPPPWRYASPLPEPDVLERLNASEARHAAKGDRDAPIPITVTGRARPGDCAFVLPLGGHLAIETHHTLVLRDRKFVGDEPPSAAEPLLRPHPPQEVRKVAEYEVSASPPIRVGPTFVRLAAVRDLPRPGRLLLVLAIAWLAFVLTAMVGTLRMGWREGRATLALSTVTFLLLVFRLLLAYRFALDPAHTDDFVVKGVFVAVLLLAVLPSAMIAAAAIMFVQRISESEPSHALEQHAPLLLLALGQGLVYLLVRVLAAGLYPSVTLSWRSRETVVFGGWCLAAILRALFDRVLPALGIVGVAGATRSWPRFIADPLVALAQPFGLVVSWLSKFAWLDATGAAVGRSLRDIALAPSTFFNVLATEWAPHVWEEVVHTTRYRGPEFRRHGAFFVRYAGFAVLTLALLALARGATRTLGGTKFLQETVAPVLFCWIPAVLWLGTRLVCPPGAVILQFLRARFVAVLILLLVAAGLYPFAVHDPGSLFVLLAVLLPMALLLLAGGRPIRIALVALAVLAVVAVGALTSYLNIESIVEHRHGLAGAATVRVLVFKEPRGQLQHSLAWVPSRRDDGSVSFTASELAQALQHNWENAAIAHAGGWRGLGFGGAPTRRSQVRQETIQADSTFSFFVLGDYGAVGGIALLLLFALPLVVVLRAGRHRFDIGRGLAALIAASFLLEACTQAAMNLGVIPMTGRYMPLLGVNSDSDALKWMLLLALLAQAMLWGAEGAEDADDPACVSILTAPSAVVPGRDAAKAPAATATPSAPPPAAPVPSPGAATSDFDVVDDGPIDEPEEEPADVDEPSVAASSRVEEEGKWPMRWAWGLLGGASLVVIGLIAGACVGNLADGSLADPFDWSGLLDEVNHEVGVKAIYWDNAAEKIVAAPWLKLDRNTLIGQEIERFNALPASEKFEGVVPGVLDSLEARLRSARSVDQYDATMAFLRGAWSRAAEARRPSLFRLVRTTSASRGLQREVDVDTTFRLTANPDYNTQVSFASGRSARDFPYVTYRDGRQGNWLVSGGGATVYLGPPEHSHTSRRVVLDVHPDGAMVVSEDDRPGAGAADVYFQYRVKGRARPHLAFFAHFERSGPLLVVRSTPASAAERIDGVVPFQVTRADSNVVRTTSGNRLLALGDGDEIQARQDVAAGVWPVFTARCGYDDALIGPAWVMGGIVPATNLDASLPWARTLAWTLGPEWTRLGSEKARARYGRLTLDRALQASAQGFVASRGRALHGELLADPERSRTWKSALPPRVALAVLDATDGSVLALGGWPRMAAGDQWTKGANQEWSPPAPWLEHDAPVELRNRYDGDRNFDRLVAGSATKPLIAAAVLAAQARRRDGFETHLRVKGLARRDSVVFGITLPSGWTVHPSQNLYNKSGWADLTSYLALSDNRYEVRLGFLGLAQPLPSAPEGVVSVHYDATTETESMDAVTPRPWQATPVFPPELKFSLHNPRQLVGVADTPLADHLRSMFAIGAHWHDVSSRLSFWSGDERDDWRADSAGASTDRPTRRFVALSPAAADFALDSIATPRQFVNILLGGGNNTWANVDYAGAFATCVRGTPVVPHVAAGVTPAPFERDSFQDVAALLLPGLHAVVMSPHGTANGPMVLSGTPGFLRDLEKDGIYVYGKTGTLNAGAEDEEGPATHAKGAHARPATPDNSRLAIAIVHWRDGHVDRGLVLSLVAERAGLGRCSTWMGEFVRDNREWIRNWVEGTSK